MTTKQQQIMLRAILDSLDDLPESISVDPRTLYREGEGDLKGKYVFGPDGFETDGFGIAAPAKLHQTIESERRTARTASRAKEQIEKELKAARERLAELEDRMAEGHPDAAAVEKAIEARLQKRFETNMQQAIAEKDAALQQVTGRRDAYEKQARELLAAQLSGARSEKFDFDDFAIGPRIRERVQVTIDDETGEFSADYLDQHGQPGRRPDGGKWGLDDLLSEFARDQRAGKYVSPRTAQPAETSQVSRHARGPSSQNGRGVVLTQQDLTDFRAYEQAAERAERDGVPLIAPPTS